eukprot:TRINITY_DN3961_c0_g1_i10.p1 TRINITY_DN3961_c0_g1~~TRINITY_DN3961_c0_g1_i10.p1  ORF type:complete len:694 (-),score=200.01 TRINITY_DN3961_c0_g1_i10:268-2184(-)
MLRSLVGSEMCIRDRRNNQQKLIRELEVKSFADKKELRNLSANVAAIEDDIGANAQRIAELEEEASAKENRMNETRDACNGTEAMHQELNRQREETEARIQMMEEQTARDSAKIIETKQLIEDQKSFIESLSSKLSQVEQARASTEKKLKDMARNLSSARTKSADLELRCYDEQVLVEYYNSQCNRAQDESRMEADVQGETSEKLKKLRDNQSRAYRARHSTRTTELVSTMAAMVPVSLPIQPQEQPSTPVSLPQISPQTTVHSTPPDPSTTPDDSSLEEKVTMTKPANFAAGFMSAAADLQAADELQELSVSEGTWEEDGSPIGEDATITEEPILAEQVVVAPEDEPAAKVPMLAIGAAPPAPTQPQEDLPAYAPAFGAADQPEVSPFDDVFGDVEVEKLDETTLNSFRANTAAAPDPFDEPDIDENPFDDDEGSADPFDDGSADDPWSGMDGASPVQITDDPFGSVDLGADLAGAQEPAVFGADPFGSQAVEGPALADPFGETADDPFGSIEEPSNQAATLSGAMDDPDPFGSQDPNPNPHPHPQDPFGVQEDPFSAAEADPFGSGTLDQATVDDPFGSVPATSAPFGSSDQADPFSAADPFGATDGNDPFGASSSDPWSATDTADPFGGPLSECR